MQCSTTGSFRAEVCLFLFVVEVAVGIGVYDVRYKPVQYNTSTRSPVVEPLIRRTLHLRTLLFRLRDWRLLLRRRLPASPSRLKWNQTVVFALYMAPKRPHDWNSETNGRKKWKGHQLKAVPNSILFRVLCPSSKSGSLIGKGGGVVTKIRQETGAKVKIEEPVPGCDERIVVIADSEKDVEKDIGQKKENDEVKDNNENVDEGDHSVEGDENAEAKIVSSLEPSQSEKVMSSGQKALLLIFEKIVDVESQNDDAGEKNDEPATVIFRILVESSQVGCLLGKGGSVIKQMSAESGAQIRILPKDKLPLCVKGFDELVQITGLIDEARKALQSVSQQLMESHREHEPLSTQRNSGSSANSFSSFPRPEIPRGEILPASNFHLPVPPYSTRFHEPEFLPPPFPRFPEGPALGRMRIPPEAFTFRFLCLNDKVGGLIGKGGSIVKMLQHDTGCDIKVIEPSPESDDRVIAITGPVLPDDRISPPQDCASRVLERIAVSESDVMENAVSFKVIVSSNQTGCLLGKGGSIITEMRRSTGAHIRILPKDMIPKFALENDEEVVQVTGNPDTAQDALMQISSRLKHHVFRDRFPDPDHPRYSSFINQSSPFGSYMGRREPSPPVIFSHMGPPFRKIDPIESFRLHDEQAYAHSLPPSNGERLPPAPWRASGIGDDGNPMNIHYYPGGALQRRMGGFTSGNQQNFITNTTVDVIVPRSVVPSIYGEDGYALRQVRQISGANITIDDPKPGGAETKITISGAPDQTHAAQSLIQAFVLSESETP